jgi:hypothetical protein
VGESNDDQKALIGSAPSFPGPGFLLPARNGELFRWCLNQGLRIVQPMTLMSRGLYNEPASMFLPSILHGDGGFSRIVLPCQHREVLVDSSLGSSLEDQQFMASILGRSWLTAVLTARAALPVGSIARDWHAAKGTDRADSDVRLALLIAITLVTYR